MTPWRVSTRLILAPGLLIMMNFVWDVFLLRLRWFAAACRCYCYAVAVYFAQRSTLRCGCLITWRRCSMMMASKVLAHCLNIPLLGLDAIQ